MTIRFAYLCFGLFFSMAANAQLSFNGTGTGPIPDNDPSGLTVTFPVSGLGNSVNTIELEIDAQHTWVGDLVVTLTAPNGIASINVFGSTGYLRSGNNGHRTNLNGIYTFHDQAAGDWWGVVSGQDTTFDIPPGEYRSSTASTLDSGGIALSGYGGCTTRLNGAFYGLTPDQANGDWTMNVRDQFGGDIGSINTATLSISQQNNMGDLIYYNGLEDAPGITELPLLSASNVLGNCQKSRFDFTGTGLASFVLIDDVDGDIEWTIQDNDGTTAGALESFIFGRAATDFVMEGDIDGDGFKDPIIWRPGPEGQAAYYVRRSSRPNDQLVRVIMGAQGNDAIHLGDYDLDGIEDFAIFEAPSVAGPTTFTIQDSSTGLRRDFNLADGTPFTVFVSGGYDISGDGIADVALQRTTPGVPGQGQFIVYDGSSGASLATVPFGNNTDLVNLGNTAGNFQTDLNVGRNEGGTRNHYTKEAQDGTETGPIAWGLGTDFILSGDYDGDGYDDFAFFRGDVAGRFEVRPSSDPGTPIVVNLGTTGDYPVANSRVR